MYSGWPVSKLAPAVVASVPMRSSSLYDGTTAEANFDTTHPLYRRIAELAALRERYPALADGAQLHRYASGRAGIYAFSRISPEENREYVVAVNNAATEQRASFDTLMERGTFTVSYTHLTLPTKA